MVIKSLKFIDLFLNNSKHVYEKLFFKERRLPNGRAESESSTNSIIGLKTSFWGLHVNLERSGRGGTVCPGRRQVHRQVRIPPELLAR